MIHLQSIYATDYIKVEINTKKEYVEITWLQQHTSTIFRKELSLIVSYADEYDITRILYDVRERSYLEIADQNWVMKEIVPLLNGENLKLAYLVNPISLVSMDVYRVQDALVANSKIRSSINVEVFLTKEDAQRWLFS
ncbi:hypothetical protein [Adhaeribacter radiodurans]|uniref:STAS/SEC14 domain-containing protein n=1 Tax=Adhaeribacter radiodurans TaxID=2745197 RepID=A0A7L7L322_9BACT|nr:hypothetical protein [Adhaeribacter radiodurans]QMU26975.1 hypothetical protein HUW48_02535 [Adhaeribacter radiodurans]